MAKLQKNTKNPKKKKKIQNSKRIAQAGVEKITDKQTN